MVERPPDRRGHEAIREASIPLPSRDDGYATVMLVGTTGSGKTTVLRHLIGSDHERDRFPSTSTARTTTADIEIVISDGSYAAVITFMGQREVRDEIERCLHQACQAAANNQRDETIARRLLSSQDQRFRLSYPLGRWEPRSTEEDSSQTNMTDLDDQFPDDNDSISGEERVQNQNRLEDYVSRIRAIAQHAAERTSASGSTLSEARGAGERRTWIELFEETVETEDTFRDLVDDILEEVRKRFNWIDSGQFTLTEDDWPLAWEYETQTRDIFLKEVKWFSSNYREQFGRLLTPMVNGVRVRGPFTPADNRLQTGRKLVILDGEGLGHGARSATSIRSEITDRFAQVDVILLVDNAQQPMLAASQELMKAAGSTGYAEKLAFAYTHFENVTGDDMYTIPDREERVRSPGRDAVDTLRDSVGDDVAEDLADRVEDYAFFFESMDKPTTQLPSLSISEMRKLLETIEEAAHPEIKTTVKIRLSSRDLDMAIKDAVERFHEPWEGWLGIRRHPDYTKEHWTRIKALTLRVLIGQNGYDILQPVDDLRSRLQEAVSRWLNRPATVLEADGTPEERQATLTTIRQGVYASLQSISVLRVARQHSVAWTVAYSHSGTGSSYRRADEVERIYRAAAPAIEFDQSMNAQELINAVYQSVQSAVEAVDGRLD